MTETARFLNARDQLLRMRHDGTDATEEFRWPVLERFNWARDYFDLIARGNHRLALRVVSDAEPEQSLTFAQLSRRSHQVAAFMQDQGIAAGDRVLVMLGNVIPLWETILAMMRLGAVIIPAATLLQRDDLRDRLERGTVKAIVADLSLADRFTGLPGAPVRISIGGAACGWRDFRESAQAPSEFTSAATRADDLLFLYFTSGTTARPKLVAHTHQSYPVGHLSTMYWLGVRPGDVHLNLSSPGWAKHAWSCVFAPWNAEATVLAYHYERFQPAGLLDQLVRCRVTTFCAPPTVWRMLIQERLQDWSVTLREVASTGEPLNSEVVTQVRAAWGLDIRDAFGQTETTAQVGNPPGHRLKPGSMGRPLPGYPVVLLTPDGAEGEEGEICLALCRRPLGLMKGYLDDADRTAEVMRDGYYHSGDVASRDTDGYLTYVGRMDDVFKSSDYRISPFELESLLLEHPAVAEAAVVPTPDALRLAVPKAYILLARGYAPDAETARGLFEFIRDRASPYKRIRKLEFRELPKTISGKIRRVDLRREELAQDPQGPRRPYEFHEDDFPELRVRTTGVDKS
jgi:acetyl-CoA synthetase